MHATRLSYRASSTTHRSESAVVVRCRSWRTQTPARVPMTLNRLSGDAGMATTGFVLAAGLALWFFVLLTNMIVWQYGRGVVRDALDEGVRAGSFVGVPATACLETADAVRSQLLGGAMGDRVRLTCVDDGFGIQATADVVFPAWLPGIPDWNFQLEARRLKEVAP